MIFVCPILYVGWKLAHRTRILRATERDIKRDLDEVEEHEATHEPAKAG